MLSFFKLKRNMYTQMDRGDHAATGGALEVDIFVGLDCIRNIS